MDMICVYVCLRTLSGLICIVNEALWTLSLETDFVCFLEQSTSRTTTETPVGLLDDLHCTTCVSDTCVGTVFVRRQVLSMLLPENVFVSVYESGSSDDTSAWTSILGGMLKMMEVPHVVITNSTDAKVTITNAG